MPIFSILSLTVHCLYYTDLLRPALVADGAVTAVVSALRAAGGSLYECEYLCAALAELARDADVALSLVCRCSCCCVGVYLLGTLLYTLVALLYLRVYVAH